MHIIIKDPLTGETLAILCVERSVHSCQILHCDIDRIPEITGVALGMKVNEVRIIVPLEAVAEMQDMGYKQSTTTVVMTRSNGK